MKTSSSRKRFSVVIFAFIGITAALLGQTTNSTPALNMPPPLQLVVPKTPSAKIPAIFDPAIPAMTDLLLDACRQSDVNHAAYLLDHGAAVNGRGKDGVTPLILAATRSPEMVKLILSHLPDLELQDDEGYTALACACWKGQTECGTELIAAGAPIETPDKTGRTPLMLAIGSGDDALVKALLDHHAKVNAASEEDSAIWQAVAHDRLGEVAMLIGAGADFQRHSTAPSDPKVSLFCLLSAAATTNDLALLDFLLAHGAEINGTDTDGATPLIDAIEYGHAATVLHLLDKGADPKRADGQGKTALMWSMEYQQEPVWQALLQRGLDINAKDRAGRTALIDACQEIYLPAVRWAVEHGAGINIADAQGNTPLAYAGDRGETEIMKFLQEHGAHPVDPHIIAKEPPSTPLSTSHRWALAVSALYFQWNGLNPHELGGEENAERAQRVLLKDWRINDQKSLERVVEALRFNGARRRFQARGSTLAAIPNWTFWLLTFQETKPNNESKAIRENYQSWHERSGLAGDLCRAAYLVNEGFASHYIAENEAWNLLLPIARFTQSHFSSWHEMCDNYLDAREMWTGGSDPALDVCGDLLCNSKDPNSPWNQIPWNADLSLP